MVNQSLSACMRFIVDGWISVAVEQREVLMMTLSESVDVGGRVKGEGNSN